MAVILDGVAVGLKKYTRRGGILEPLSLTLPLFTGLYLFVLPYAAKRRSGRGTG